MLAPSCWACRSCVPQQGLGRPPIGDMHVAPPQGMRTCTAAAGMASAAVCLLQEPWPKQLRSQLALKEEAESSADSLRKEVADLRSQQQNAAEASAWPHGPLRADVPCLLQLMPQAACLLQALAVMGTYVLVALQSCAHDHERDSGTFGLHGSP